MARGLNKILLIGNLGGDPETKTFANGGSVTTCSLASSETWKDKNGQQQEHTEWFNLSFNDKLGEIAQKYLRKGSKVYVEGSMKTRKYQGADGKEARFTEVRVKEMMMLDGAPADGQSQRSQGGHSGTPARTTPPAGHQGGGHDPMDDIPFAPRHWKEG